MDDREVGASDTNPDCSEADGSAGVTSDEVRLAAKTPEHLSAHEADFPHSPFPDLSQSCPCGQQSD